MKNMRYIIHLAYAAALLLAACTDDQMPAQDEETVVHPVLSIAVAEMTMNISPDAQSRAVIPMHPDMEKYVKSIAFFEFDSEGLHIKDNNTYHFVDFVAGTVDGDKVMKPIENGIVETTLDGLAFVERDFGTICLVANVTEDQVNRFYNDYREQGHSYGRMTLERFKMWALPFEYEQEAEGTYDESISGHLKVMYMFGYYEGKIKADAEGSFKAIRIDLGRLASRLDITIVNETGEEITKRLGYHFDNVCSSAFFFPLKTGMPPTIGAGLTRTVICKGATPPQGGGGEDDPVASSDVPETFANGDSHTRYFYTAAHSAKDSKDATQLHLFYDRRIVNDAEDNPANSVKIPMCNVYPSHAADVPNGYSLSRNTRYHFTIHLKPGSAAPAGKAVDSRAAVEYGESPGHITVYLP